ncbi:jg7084 [Pararge aegeria aegeria]|uniref:Jg7084 protein n=1 Tax=Pararge aegeria aegeria TaxID=348720 RepID=A0A8S4R055_9NEOP|nr:jg7084 [Pararge aegeria aegeria]
MQRAVEKAMLGVSLRDQNRNEIRVALRVAKLKWKWAGHIARRTDCHWVKRCSKGDPASLSPALVASN